MSGNMVFGCTALVGVNKAGTLRPDSDGYYTVVLGALDFENSTGAIYPQVTARQIIAGSSNFMRRLKAGYCRGEMGHPKRPAGMSMRDWMIRIMTIEETRISHHISEVWIDTENVVYNGRKIVAIMGKIRPSGPYGSTLKDMLDNPKENVAFSIRSITDDEYVGGRLYKNIVDICCWDFVVEPGLAPAQKYCAPSLESVGTDLILPTKEVRRVIYEPGGISLESNGVLEGLRMNLNRKFSRMVMDVRPPSSQM